MLKKPFIIIFMLLALLVSTAATAEVTNRDMQLLGGVVVSNSSDSFFFAPMEEGVTRHWGLYALSSCNDGPIKEIADGYPARLVHADDQYVYFFGYWDIDRTIHTLYSVNIQTGEVETLLEDVATAFVEDSAAFMYVTSADPYTLRRYDITARKASTIKDMSNSSKTIYDAIVYKDQLFFTTKTASGAEDAYEYHASSGKATNLDKPSGLVTSVLYEGYRIYTDNATETRVYAVLIGNKTGVQLGKNYKNVSLTSPRFGDAIYTYDGDNNLLVRIPLDGSAESTLALDDTVSRFVLGGSKDELFFYNNGGIYSIKPDLSSSTRLFDFDGSTAGQMWCYIAPAGNDAILVFGYGQEAFSLMNNMMPTGVYAYDRSGNVLFGFPENTEEAQTIDSSAFISTPVEQERDEGETYFQF